MDKMVDRTRLNNEKVFTNDENQPIEVQGRPEGLNSVQRQIRSERREGEQAAECQMNYLRMIQGEEEQLSDDDSSIEDIGVQIRELDDLQALTLDLVEVMEQNLFKQTEENTTLNSLMKIFKSTNGREKQTKKQRQATEEERVLQKEWLDFGPTLLKAAESKFRQIFEEAELQNEGAINTNEEIFLQEEQRREKIERQVMAEIQRLLSKAKEREENSKREAKADASSRLDEELKTDAKESEEDLELKEMPKAPKESDSTECEIVAKRRKVAAFENKSQSVERAVEEGAMYQGLHENKIIPEPSQEVQETINEILLAEAIIAKMSAKYPMTLEEKCIFDVATEEFGALNKETSTGVIERAKEILEIRIRSLACKQLIHQVETSFLKRLEASNNELSNKEASSEEESDEEVSSEEESDEKVGSEEESDEEVSSEEESDEEASSEEVSSEEESGEDSSNDEDPSEEASNEEVSCDGDSNEEATDDEATNEGSSNGEVSNEEASSEEGRNDGNSDYEASDEGSNNGDVNKVKASNDEASSREVRNIETSDYEASDERSGNEHGKNLEASKVEVSCEEVSNEETSEEAARKDEATYYV